MIQIFVIRSAKKVVTGSQNTVGDQEVEDSSIMHHLSFLEHTNYKLLSQIIVGLSVIGQCRRKAKGESVIQHVSQNNFGRSDGAVAEWQLLTSRAFLLLPDILAVKSCSQLCHVDFYLWRLA